MRINTNVASLQAQEAAKNTAKSQSSSLEKLGTGLAINKASDDGAGLAIADKLRTQASSIGQSLSNANSASALVNIADKAMSEQSNILDTIKTKLIQAGTSTTTDDGREAIRKDVTKLLEQFDNIASQTNYNGMTLLQSSSTDQAAPNTFSFQMGEDKTYDIDLTLSKAANTADLGGGSDSVSQGHNIEGKDGEFLKASGGGAITLTNILLSSDGGDKSTASSTAALDFDFSGKMDSLSADNGNIVIDASNQSDDVKNVLKEIAANNTSFSVSGDTFTLASGASLTFSSDVEFSGLNITSSKSSGEISITEDSGFKITNNASSGVGNHQINVSGTADDIKGGELLSSLKNLGTDGLTTDKANSFMATVDEALTQLNGIRTDFGSAQNQIESSIRNLETTFTNIKAAESVIRDVDYAAESASFNKQNIIAQAGTYAMSQANAMQQNVSRLLQ